MRDLTTIHPISEPPRQAARGTADGGVRMRTGRHRLLTIV